MPMPLASGCRLPSGHGPDALDTHIMLSSSQNKQLNRENLAHTRLIFVTPLAASLHDTTLSYT